MVNQSRPQPTPLSTGAIRARWVAVGIVAALLVLADLAWVHWIGWLPVDKVVIAELLFLAALGFGLTLPTHRVIPFDAGERSGR